MSTSMTGADATGASSTAANGAVGTPSAAAAPLAVGSPAAAKPPAGAWEPGDTCCWVPGPPAGMTLEAVGEEVLANNDGLRPTRMMTTLANKDGTALTWGPGPSSDPKSGTSAAVAAAAAHEVATAGPMAVAVAVMVDPMVVVAEDCYASAP
jgi:hypothetical protein